MDVVSLLLLTGVILRPARAFLNMLWKRPCFFIGSGGANNDGEGIDVVLLLLLLRPADEMEDDKPGAVEGSSS